VEQLRLLHVQPLRVGLRLLRLGLHLPRLGLHLPRLGRRLPRPLRSRVLLQVKAL
jgi:hypothetical protein